MIDVVITCYNNPETIARAVKSCVEQQGVDVHVVVVDDCSGKHVSDSLGELASDKRIDVVRNERNVGAGMSRKIGLSRCIGEYVMFVDSDDWIEDGYLNELYDAAVESGSEIVCGGITVHNKSGNIKKIDYGRGTIKGVDMLKSYFGRKMMFLNDSLISRGLFIDVEYSSRRYIEDVQTMVKLLWYADSVTFVENHGYHYEYNETSLTRTASEFKNVLFRMLALIDIVKFFYEKDKSMLKEFPFEEAYYYGLKRMSECVPSNEELNKYASELEEIDLFTKN